ncbi:hypothetical protein RF11_14342 [Thelohanellus kitauei]|uniref:Uncharacterized protein n=1 Tax=Thelohanellus kitauei TaxID=669202 RepID=A0A0C2MCH8_THEKT|nr:hypothetical protein RF11_14342 [Thelohanellus kitauei]
MNINKNTTINFKFRKSVYGTPKHIFMTVHAKMYNQSTHLPLRNETQHYHLEKLQNECKTTFGISFMKKNKSMNLSKDLRFNKEVIAYYGVRDITDTLPNMN